MAQEIQYPVALSAEGEIVNIGEVPRERGHHYSCVYCNSPMSAVVKVTKISPHFRHTQEVRCDADSALHTYAIKMIQQAHRRASATGASYMLLRKCATCGGGHSVAIDLADGWQCAVDTTIAMNTRSDIAFTHPDGRRIAVEVVVTHGIEPDTDEAYREAGVQVAVIRPTWKTITNLLTELQFADLRNFDADLCVNCEDARRQREHKLQMRINTVDTVLARMERKRSPTVQFKPWYYGKPSIFGIPTPMYPRTQQRVFANAIILTELGFSQCNEAKPWLFSYIIQKRDRVILYGDLGGSDVVPIYEDTAVMLYVFRKNQYDDDETGHGPCCAGSPIDNYIIETFGERLQDFGVDVRIGFPAPVRIEHRGCNPLRAVNGSLVSSLIRHDKGKQFNHSGYTCLGGATSEKDKGGRK